MSVGGDDGGDEHDAGVDDDADDDGQGDDMLGVAGTHGRVGGGRLDGSRDGGGPLGDAVDRFRPSPCNLTSVMSSVMSRLPR